MTAWCQASVKSEFLERVRAVRSEAELARVLSEAPVTVLSDDHIAPALASSDATGNWRTRKRSIESALELVVVSEAGASDSAGKGATARAKSVLANPKYRDSGVRGNKNWMSRSFERLAQWLQEQIQRLNRRPSSAAVAPGILPIGLLEPLVWGLLAIGLIVFLTFAILKFRWAVQRGRRLGVLADDEPELTADEWLTRAADLERSGHLREAVRCLYLAALTRLDEAGHLRFVRAETNWEHLRRFENNEKRPTELDLRLATKEFDRIWYGHRINGASDVEWFRAFYQSVLATMRRTP